MESIEKRLARLEHALKEAYPDYGWTEADDRVREVITTLISQMSNGAADTLLTLHDMEPSKIAKFWSRLNHEYVDIPGLIRALVANAYRLREAKRTETVGDVCHREACFCQRDVLSSNNCNS